MDQFFMEPLKAPNDGTDLQDEATGSLAVAKWGSAVDAGFQIVPNVLLRGQAKLGLDPLDLVIILNITLHWWQPGDLPFPQPRVIANRTGVSIRTVERRLEALQERGFLERLAPEKSRSKLRQRRIDLSGLVKKLQEFSIVNLAQRDKARESFKEGET
jgi:DNA-binding MarR family transcriptional regulator